MPHVDGTSAGHATGRHPSGRPSFDQDPQPDSTGQDTGDSGVPSLEEVNRRRAITGLPPLSEQAYEDEFLEEEESFSDEFFWQETIIDQIETDIKNIAKEYDLDLTYVEGWFNGQKDSLIGYLEEYQSTPAFGENPDPGSIAGMGLLVEQARTWVGSKWPAFFQARAGIRSGATSGSRGSRGRSGRRRPTAAEIRAQFDMDQLTNAVNQMSRALLLEESDDAKAIAEAYVGAIVQNPDQKLDFETFAREKILSKPRAKLIYANKPEGMSEEQFLQPFFQAAQQRIGPGFGSQAADIAIEGARFGASPQAFQARLNRTRQVQSSAPFLRNLGEKIGSVRKVLK